MYNEEEQQQQFSKVLSIQKYRHSTKPEQRRNIKPKEPEPRTFDERDQKQASLVERVNGEKHQYKLNEAKKFEIKPSNS